MKELLLKLATIDGKVVLNEDTPVTEKIIEPEPRQKTPMIPSMFRHDEPDNDRPLSKLMRKRPLSKEAPSAEMDKDNLDPTKYYIFSFDGKIDGPYDTEDEAEYVYDNEYFGDSGAFVASGETLSTEEDPLGEDLEGSGSEATSTQDPKMWRILKGEKLFTVYVVHNFYNGRYYDYSGQSINVLAFSPEEALQTARENKDVIETYLRSKKVRSGDRLRNLISKNDTYHLKDRDIHSPKEKQMLPGYTYTALTSDGIFKNLIENDMMDEGEVVPFATKKKTMSSTKGQGAGTSRKEQLAQKIDSLRKRVQSISSHRTNEDLGKKITRYGPGNEQTWGSRKTTNPNDPRNDLDDETPTCNQCGHEISLDDRSCRHCGAGSKGEFSEDGIPQATLAETPYQSPHAKLAQLKVRYEKMLNSPKPNVMTLRKVRDQIIKLKFDLGLESKQRGTGKSTITEKSTSEKQARFMAACSHGAGYSGCPSNKVSKEFNQKDKGTKMLSNAMKHKKTIEGKTVFDHITKKRVPIKSIKQKAGGPVTRNGVPVDMSKEFNQKDKGSKLLSNAMKHKKTNEDITGPDSKGEYHIIDSPEGKPDHRVAGPFKSWEEAVKANVKFKKQKGSSSVKEAKKPYNPSQKYPDNEQGVKMFADPKGREMQASYAKALNINGPHTKIIADPSVEGVWAIKNYETAEMVIIYLAGYKDPFGDIRKYNDFESGLIPKKDLARYREIHDMPPLKEEGSGKEYKKTNETKKYSTTPFGKIARQVDLYLEDKGFVIHKIHNGYSWVTKDYIIELDYDPADQEAARWAAGTISRRGKKEFSSSGTDSLDDILRSIKELFGDYTTETQEDDAGNTTSPIWGRQNEGKTMAKNKLTESMLFEVGDKDLEKVLSRFPHETKNFIDGNGLGDHLFDALFDHYFQSGEMPYGTAKARDGDPYQWIEEKLAEDLNLYKNEWSPEQWTRGDEPDYPEQDDIPGEMEEGAAGDAFSGAETDGNQAFEAVDDFDDDFPEPDLIIDWKESPDLAVIKFNEILKHNFGLSPIRMRARPGDSLSDTLNRLIHSIRITYGITVKNTSPGSDTYAFDFVKEPMMAEESLDDDWERNVGFDNPRFADGNMDEEEWYDAEGNLDPNGAYDADGNYYPERDADRLDYERDAARDRELLGDSTDEIDHSDDLWNDAEGHLNPDGKFDISGNYDMDHNTGDLDESVLTEGLESVITDILTNVGLDEGLDFFFEDGLVVIGRSTAKVVISALRNSDLINGTPSIESMDGEEVRITFNKKPRPVANPKDVASLAQEPTEITPDEEMMGESKQTKAEVRAEIEKVSKKIDDIVKDGGKVGLNDPLSVKLKKLREKLKTIKEEVSMTVNANGEEDVLNVIRKLSGLAPVEAEAEIEPEVEIEEPVDDDEEVEFTDEFPGEDDEVEEADEQYTNAPDPTVHTSTNKMLTRGEDLNRPKRQSYQYRGLGNNPMAEARALMKQYEALKDELKAK